MKLIHLFIHSSDRQANIQITDERTTSWQSPKGSVKGSPAHQHSIGIQGIPNQRRSTAFLRLRNLSVCAHSMVSQMMEFPKVTAQGGEGPCETKIIRP